ADCLVNFTSWLQLADDVRDKPVVREPERAVRRERERAKGVALAELPHSGEQLREAAIEQRERKHADQQAAVKQVCVEDTENERRHREAGQAEWARVANGRRGYGWRVVSGWHGFACRHRAWG